MEEGTLAGWALEICAHFGEKLIITPPYKLSADEQSPQAKDIALRAPKLIGGDN